MKCWVALLGAGLIPWAAVAQDVPQFEDGAAVAGLVVANVSGAAVKEFIIQSTGNGGGLVDFDGDGDLDLLLAQGSTLERMHRPLDPLLLLYRNDGDGRFVPFGERAGLDDHGWANGLCAADFDGDDDQDLYVTAHGPNRFYRNDGAGRFEEVAGALGVDDSRWSTSCAFADYDRDGRVDLYVASYVVFEGDRLPPRGCNYMGNASFCGPLGMIGEPDVLYRNLGDRFEDVTEAAGLAVKARYGMALFFADIDGDEFPDLFVANDSQPNYFFGNRRDGTFEETGLLSGLALSGRAEAQAAMGVGLGDIDSDGDFDLFITNFSQDHNTLYRNEGRSTFSDITFLAGVGSIPNLAWGTGFHDFDNDGAVDLFVANGHIYEDVAEFGIGSTYEQRNQLFINDGSGRFLERTDEVGPGFQIERSSRGAAFGDIDSDGDIDILAVNMAAPPTLLLNQGPRRGGFLSLRLIGRGGHRDGLGATVELAAAGRRQISQVRSGASYQSTNDLRQHFGLGLAATVDSVGVRWPGRGGQRFLAPPADRFLVVPES